MNSAVKSSNREEYELHIPDDVGESNRHQKLAQITVTRDADDKFVIPRISKSQNTNRPDQAKEALARKHSAMLSKQDESGG